MTRKYRPSTSYEYGSIHSRLFIRWHLGGNQRDQDRLKAQKKAAANAKKPKESAASLAKRKEA
jgi:hypothetical protein